MEVDHLDGADGRVGALIAHLRARAFDGLLDGVDGENTEDDGDGTFASHPGNSSARFARNVLIVVGGAADHAAEADDRVESARMRQTARDRWNLESAGNSDDRAVIFAGAVTAYRAALELGGSRTLPELFEAAGARFDFSYETLAPLVELLQDEL